MRFVWLSFLLLGLLASCCCGKSVIKVMNDSGEAGRELLKNGDFEQVEGATFPGWTAYGEGYVVAKGEGRNGSNALYCQSDSTNTRRGGEQTVEVNQKEASPVRITCWSRCENVDGSANPDYSIYVDIVCVDGTPMWGNMRAFQSGTSDWNKWTYTIYPTKPIKSINVYCLFRNRKGRVWFDDVKVEELKAAPGIKMLQGQVVTMATNGNKSKAVEVGTKTGLSLTLEGAGIASVGYSGRKYASKAPGGFLARDVKNNSDYYQFDSTSVSKNSISAKCTELGLKLNAKFTCDVDSIRVKGKITDTKSADRAINLLFALPVDAVGWTWWDDVDRSRQITASSTNVTALEYATTVDVPCGSTTTASLYPIAAISGNKDGLCLGIDMDKVALYRILYNSSTRQFIVSYDFALIPENIKSPSCAEFSLLYTDTSRLGDSGRRGLIMPRCIRNSSRSGQPSMGCGCHSVT